MDWKDALSAARNNFQESPKEPELSSEPPRASSTLPQKGVVSVIIDKKGRNGKTATIIEGLSIPQNEVEELARSLKQKLGVGGSVREGEILIQGNHKEKVVNFLQKLNFKVK